jgi:cytidylate kinase
MYRAVTAKVLRLGIDPEDTEAVLAVLPSIHVELRRVDGSLRVFLDAKDVTDEIRSPAVTRSVSRVSSIPGVRQAMVREQRLLGAEGGVVLEGRDIGTVVFPDADLKIFLVAGIRARAERRRQELGVRGTPPPLGDVVRELEERDRLDSTRDTSPLRKADDAVELDTSEMTIEEQVNAVIRKAEKVMAERGRG